jgi:hypothetical protein
MAAPAATIRQAPTGKPLLEGFPTKIAFARLPNVSFWEKQVKPPGMDGGDAIDITTMFNTQYRTKAARTLVDNDDITVRAAYDPLLYTQILSLINQEGAITITHPDGTTDSWWGYMRSFMPAENREGTQPEAEIRIVITNWDIANAVEAGVAHANVAGT